MRLRVVSLPATTSVTKKRLSSSVVEPLAVDLGLHERGHDVVARVGAAVGGDGVAQP